MLPSCVNASLNDRLDICIYLRSPPEKLLPINFNYRPLDQPLIETFHVKYHFFNMLISHGEYFTLLYQNFHNLIHAYPFKTNASNIYSLYSPLLSFFFLLIILIWLKITRISVLFTDNQFIVSRFHFHPNSRDANFQTSLRGLPYKFHRRERNISKPKIPPPFEDLPRSFNHPSTHDSARFCSRCTLSINTCGYAHPSRVWLI